MLHQHISLSDATFLMPPIHQPPVIPYNDQFPSNSGLALDARSPLGIRPGQRQVMNCERVIVAEAGGSDIATTSMFKR
jgi:hypothetical protein